MNISGIKQIVYPPKFQCASFNTELFIPRQIPPLLITICNIVKTEFFDSLLKMPSRKVWAERSKVILKAIKVRLHNCLIKGRKCFVRANI